MPSASIEFTPDFLVESFRNYRRQHWWRFVSFSVKLAAAALGGGMGLWLLWTGVISGGLVLLALGAFIAYSHRIDTWVLRRSIKKSPYHGEAVTLDMSEAGFHARSSKADVRLEWSAFTRVVHFPDGVLLFQGPKVFNWIPYSALEDSAQVPSLKELLVSKISEHKFVGTSRP